MTERMREKTRRESVADRYSFGHKALSVVLSVVLLGFGWPAVNPSETFASDESAQADQVQAEVAQPEETQALEETADDSAAMALAAAKLPSILPVYTSDLMRGYLLLSPHIHSKTLSSGSVLWKNDRSFR